LKIVPVTLEGARVRLEPLTLEHHAALCEVGLEPELWRWSLSDVRSPEDLRRYLQRALQDQREGVALPFATIERATGKAVGSTRFGSIEITHRRVEIGWTWIGGAWHAFEVWRAHRVEFRTNAMNYRSRTAIARLGAKEEGTLRKHMISERGVPRDTVYYSILDTEWPAVRTGLEEKMRSGT